LETSQIAVDAILYAVGKVTNRENLTTRVLIVHPVALDVDDVGEIESLFKTLDVAMHIGDDNQSAHRCIISDLEGYRNHSIV
jgi:hypothetical protein